MRIWPALPIAVSGSNLGEDVDDVVVALEQRDRVCEISLELFSDFDSEEVISTMMVPFPGLKHFSVASEAPAPVLPDTFLGGSAPRLQSLHLDGISFPSLPNLLLSARGLVHLSLSSISRPGTFSPEVIVNHISELSRLEIFCLGFRSRRSCLVPGNRSPPLARAILPALYHLRFEGATDYLDDLVSRIDAPLMRHLCVTFFNQPFRTSDFSQLRHFIGRTEIFKSLTHANINFRFRTVEVSLLQRTQKYSAELSVGVLSKTLYPQLWSLAQVGSASLLPLSKVESLEISSELFKWQLFEEHTEDDARWLDVLQPFSAVKNLYPHKNTLPSLAYALREVPEERVTEMLPALQGISIDEPSSPGPLDEPSPPAVQEDIERFIAMRHLSVAFVKSRY